MPNDIVAGAMAAFNGGSNQRQVPTLPKGTRRVRVPSVGQAGVRGGRAVPAVDRGGNREQSWSSRTVRRCPSR